MCGLAGFINQNSLFPPDEFSRRATAMANQLTQRGPDSGGVWADPASFVALAHRRLSILDLSPAGAQPMHSKCGRYVIVFNGEIYNFASLRTELEARGAEFVGHSDTEILIEGFVSWGVESTLQRANGMFALALWDRKDRRLILARDRIGEKPLYYGWNNGVFLFASELKAFHAYPGFRAAIDREALTLLLRHNYIPEPFCVYCGLRKLLPGTWLSIGVEQVGVLPPPQAYWSLAGAIESARSEPFRGSLKDGMAAVESALLESVRMRMVADVPLGAFLSGGIDSSTIVALMQAQSSRPVRTFSIGFTVPEYDEAPYARAVARHLGTDHTELYVSPEETIAVIPQLASMYDEPFADASQIPTFLVSQLARRHVTVAMSGDAGDELFAGYSRYSIAAKLWQRLNYMPSVLRVLGTSGIRALSPMTWDRIFATLRPLLPQQLRHPMAGDKLYKFADMMNVQDPFEVYLRLISMWKEPECVVIGASEPESIQTYARRAPIGLDFVERMMFLDTQHYLPGDILTKVDRASMAVGLEARVPFLDHNVIELAWRMPQAWKARNGQAKVILRDLLAQHVPRALFERPKMGFGVPIDSWLRGPLRGWAEDLLSEQRLSASGYFNPVPIRAAWKTHLTGGENLQYQLWGVLMFEAWRAQWEH